MIRMFRTMDDTIQQVEETFDGVWIALTAPTQEELKQVAETCGVEIDHLRAPLDEEERSRIEVEDSYTMTIVDIPVTEERQENEYYVTIPWRYHYYKDEYHYDMSGRYTDPGRFYGWTCPKFLYLPQDEIFFCRF